MPPPPTMVELPRLPMDSRPRAFIGDREVAFGDFAFLPMLPPGSDGSAKEANWPQLARAGWAVVQWDPAAREFRGVYGRVEEEYWQVAVAGEHEGGHMGSHPCAGQPGVRGLQLPDQRVVRGVEASRCAGQAV